MALEFFVPRARTGGVSVRPIGRPLSPARWRVRTRPLTGPYARPQKSLRLDSKRQVPLDELTRDPHVGRDLLPRHAPRRASRDELRTEADARFVQQIACALRSFTARRARSRSHNSDHVLAVLQSHYTFPELGRVAIQDVHISLAGIDHVQHGTDDCFVSSRHGGDRTPMATSSVEANATSVANGIPGSAPQRRLGGAY